MVFDRSVATWQMFVASGNQLQLLVQSGAWQHMNPPGFKRVQRSLMYRQRPDGKADVHRILANSEDVVKTRMITSLEKVRTACMNCLQSIGHAQDLCRHGGAAAKNYSPACWLPSHTICLHVTRAGSSCPVLRLDREV
jgi:hypothetical protein